MKTIIPLLLSLFFFASTSSFPILLDFEGIANVSSSPIEDFYDGGSSQETGITGPIWGIHFSPSALASYNATQGRASSTLRWDGGQSPHYMNVPDGFTRLEFDVTHLRSSIQAVQVYGGLNATGDLLETITISQSSHFESNFTGFVAHSVNFQGGINASYDLVFLEINRTVILPSNVNFLAIDGGKPNILYNFASTSPNISALQSFLLQNLQNGEQLLTIAQNKKTGILWGLSNQNGLYQVDWNTGSCSFQWTLTCNVSSSNPTLSAAFDPTTGFLHVVSLMNRHIKIDVSNGTCLDVDELRQSQGRSIQSAGIAFQSKIKNDLYLINSDPRNELGILNISSGVFTPVGSLGLKISGVGGFDIVENIGFAALYNLEKNRSDIYSIQLDSGRAFLIGNLNITTNLLGFAAAFNPSSMKRISFPKRIPEKLSW